MWTDGGTTGVCVISRRLLNVLKLSYCAETFIHRQRKRKPQSVSLNPSSPWRHVAGAGFQRRRVAYHFVQHANDVWELWPSVSVLLPAVQHQLVQHHWTVHGSWQPEVLLYGIYHLRQ